MPRSRIALYVIIGFAAALVAYYNLVMEPLPEWPINLVHLLARH